MKLKEIYENINWAIGPNITHATIRGKHDLNNPENTVIWISIYDLMNNLDPNFSINPETGEGQIKNRIPKALKHWEEGGFMDPPVASYNKWRDLFDITDGRHRLVAAYQMGDKFAPVVIPKEQVDIFREKLQTR